MDLLHWVGARQQGFVIGYLVIAGVRLHTGGGLVFFVVERMGH